jgi:hypothetical protein
MNVKQTESTYARIPAHYVLIAIARPLRIAAALLALLVFASPALAAQINYGSHMGTNVTYVNVTEDSGAAPLPLFGSPTVTGNSIDFNPVGYDATSADGGSEITASNLVFMIVAKPLASIKDINLTEAGDTTQAGIVAPGSMGTATSVFATGVLDIQEVDFAPINHISVPFSLTFSPSGGTYFLGTDGGGGPIFHTQWTGSVTLPVESILIANAVPFSAGATKVSIDMTNTLVAVSERGTSAFIGKQDIGAVSITVIVPEPATLALAGVSAVLFAAIYRRR